VRGRRVDLGNPGASLLLTKPTAALAHKGGKKLEPDSEDYRVLAEWIAAGAPQPRAGEVHIGAVVVSPQEHRAEKGVEFSLKVTAQFSDGSARDVTRLAKFTSTDETIATVDQSGRVKVIGHGEGAVTVWYASKISVARVVSAFPNSVAAGVYATVPQAGFIDALVLEKLAQLQIPPSPAAEDAVFLRRAFLDTIGRLPSPEEARAFLTDPAQDRHRSLVDRLLQRPEFVDYWTYKWSDVLLVTGSKLRPAAVKSYYDWVRARVLENTPWDELVRRVVTASGSSTDEGATNFFAVHQDPETMAENVSQAFLSLSINCAKCHNHPLEKWTNDQYYAFANLFSRVRAKGWGGDPRNGDGQRTLYVLHSGDLMQPRTGRPQPPAPLDAPPLDAADGRDRRGVLAEWLTAPENPYFTRAIVNRVWANFMGVGLVESVDDLRASNPASNEKLLSALSDYLIAQKYDLRALMRLILNSHTYRRSSVPVPGNEGDRRYYSRYYPRRLMAEVLSDAVSDVTGVRDKFSEIALNDGSTEKTEAYQDGTRAIQLYDSAVKNYFLKTFGRNQREITCECERSNQPSLVQVLHLSNGDTLNQKLADPSGRAGALAAMDNMALIRESYLRTLSREPSGRELADYTAALSGVPPEERRAAVEDLLWALLTSREFLFQH
jgi:Protein of unknown function (DUF1553)/Protein of unknown function (DUF1549)/Bacterial Ig-like domain (group 2)